jgi:hypothetical protein
MHEVLSKHALEEQRSTLLVTALEARGMQPRKGATFTCASTLKSRPPCTYSTCSSLAKCYPLLHGVHLSASASDLA